MEFMFFIVFFLVISVFVVTFVRMIGEWIGNNNSPRLTVDATVVTKRDQVHRHRSSNGHSHRSYSYYVTFQFESGDRMELRVPSHEYGLLVEGDIGKLTFQGTRYLSFERKY
ncbi:MAG: DUF2500 domain-containing protein [Clostridia bacterium]|nr:DUF2500 domain-containing protein [Clostridia bacterium]